jgi:hypothetical protein
MYNKSYCTVCDDDKYFRLYRRTNELFLGCSTCGNISAPLKNTKSLNQLTRYEPLIDWSRKIAHMK